MRKSGKKRQLVNLTQAAGILGISRPTLRHWIRANTAPAHLTIGKRRYFTREMIEQWIKAQSLA